jgi:hypothetical protein
MAYVSPCAHIMPRSFRRANVHDHGVPARSAALARSRQPASQGSSSHSRATSRSPRWSSAARTGAAKHAFSAMLLPNTTRASLFLFLDLTTSLGTGAFEAAAAAAAAA